MTDPALLAPEAPHAPSPSHRIRTLNDGGSDGWEIVYRARALRAAGEVVLDLTIGDHDRITPKLILDAMDASARGGHTGYADVPGIPALREAVAARATAQTGVPTGPENVLITAGGQAALFASFTACLDPGDTGLYIDPHYATYPGTIRAVAGVPFAIQSRAEAGFQPEREDLETAPPARALLINSPNNPTGVVYTRETMETIASFAVERNLWLISDEVYDTQVWSGAHLSPRALPDMQDRVLVVGSMSKSHVMTGSRLGWIIAEEAMIDHLADLLVTTTYGVPGYIQDAAVVALTEGERIEIEVAETYRRRKDLALGVLARSNRLSVVPPEGAMYVMVDIRATGLSGDAFADRLLDTHRIAVMPGESFGAASAGHIRIALTTSDDRLEEALGTLVTFAEALP